MLGAYWFFNPDSNIEPLIVVLAAATALYSFVSRKYKISELVHKVINKPSTYTIHVNRDGIASQSKEDLENIIDKITERIRASKPYQIHVINSDFSKILESKDNGIREALNKDLNCKLLETSNLIDLILNSWVNGLIPSASKEELFQVINGALKVASLDEQLNPFNEYIEIWFNQNHEFRTMAILEQRKANILFRHLGVSSTMQIMGGGILELPREILFSEIIPKVYYALQKYSDKRNFESMDSLFDLSYWSYGAG